MSFGSVTPLIGKVAGAGLAKLFEPDSNAVDPNTLVPRKVTTPSFKLKTGFGPGGNQKPKLVRTQSLFDALGPERQGLFGRLGELSSELRPGFGLFTQAGVNAIENARSKATGNLREQLSRRRVQGSSFANKQLSQLDLTFAEQEKQFRAESLLQEIQAVSKLTEQQNAILVEQIDTDLRELGLSADFVTNISAILTRANSIIAELDADEAAASGEFFGQVGSDIGDIFGDIFGG